MPRLEPQSRFPAKKFPEHCCVPKLPLRSPIRHSGPGLARGTLLAQALVHSSACSPSAGVSGEVVVRADTDNVPVAMCDVPVAVEDVVGDKDTRSAEAEAGAGATRIHA